MWLSSTAQNAIQAVLYLAERDAPGPVRVGDIASAMGSPQNYLSKTLHALARAGVLVSTRGPKGGFQLADPPGRLALARVVAPFQPASDRRCLVGRSACDSADPCPAHHRWSQVAHGVEQFFANTTVADLLRPPEPKPPRTNIAEPRQEDQDVATRTE
jgi:Rrf2 family iron-sulfur cluster assembly transcriptional regulator